MTLSPRESAAAPLASDDPATGAPSNEDEAPALRPRPTSKVHLAIVGAVVAGSIGILLVASVRQGLASTAGSGVTTPRPPAATAASIVAPPATTAAGDAVDAPPPPAIVTPAATSVPARVAPVAPSSSSAGTKPGVPAAPPKAPAAPPKASAPPKAPASTAAPPPPSSPLIRDPGF